MATLLQALVGGVPTLIDAQSVARNMQADTNGSNALAAGDFISASGGTIDKADAPTSKFAIGYVLGAVSASAAFSYYTDGVNTGQAGLTKGDEAILDEAGAASTTPAEPSSGQGWQSLGRAVSTTGVLFVPGSGYTRDCAMSASHEFKVGQRYQSASITDPRTKKPYVLHVVGLVESFPDGDSGEMTPELIAVTEQAPYPERNFQGAHLAPERLREVLAAGEYTLMDEGWDTAFNRQRAALEANRPAPKEKKPRIRGSGLGAMFAK